MDNMPPGGVRGGCHSLPETPGAGTPAAGQGPLLSSQQLSRGLRFTWGSRLGSAQAGAPRPALPRGHWPATLHPKERRADAGVCEMGGAGLGGSPDGAGVLRWAPAPGVRWQHGRGWRRGRRGLEPSAPALCSVISFLVHDRKWL